MAWAPCWCHFSLPLASSENIAEGPQWMLHTRWVVLELKNPEHLYWTVSKSPLLQKRALSSEAVCYTHMLEKTVQNRRADMPLLTRNAEHEKHPWRVASQHPVPLSSQYSLICLLFLLSFAPTRTWAPWEQGPSLLSLCSFPYCLKQHLADSRSSVNTSWANKSLTILLVLQDPAYPAFRGAIPDPWNWDLVFRHLGFHNTYPLSMALGVEPFVL